MDKTLVVWRRMGHEHGEGSGYHANPPEVVKRYLDKKVERFSATPGDQWRWWRVSDRLIVEEAAESPGGGPRKTFFYLPEKNWVVVRDPFVSQLDEVEWKWYVHIGSTVYDDARACWIFTDWFCDVIVMPDDRTHSVLDLDELGNALRIGLIDARLAVAILESTQKLIYSIRSGHFPPIEIKEYSNTETV